MGDMSDELDMVLPAIGGRLAAALEDRYEGGLNERPRLAMLENSEAADTGPGTSYGNAARLSARDSQRQDRDLRYLDGQLCSWWTLSAGMVTWPRHRGSKRVMYTGLLVSTHSITSELDGTCARSGSGRGGKKRARQGSVVRWAVAYRDPHAIPKLPMRSRQAESRAVGVDGKK
jgi:hypothetical protein